MPEYISYGSLFVSEIWVNLKMRIALRKRKLMASKNIQNIINPRKRLPETEYKPKVTYQRFTGNNQKLVMVL